MLIVIAMLVLVAVLAIAGLALWMGGELLYGFGFYVTEPLYMRLFIYFF